MGHILTSGSSPKVTTSDRVFGALSDRTRRRILDLLKAQPMTTGDLARRFKVTRFAVMKHLAVLAKARLITVTRQGRTRWNHLNAVPMQRVYDRWVAPLAARGAQALLSLESHILNGGVSMPSPKNASLAAGQVHEVALEISIAADSAVVWKALTEETLAWWPPDFLTSPKTKAVRFEARPGGRLYEEHSDGGGLVWFQVVAIDVGKSLDLAGYLTPAFGGPATTLLRVELSAAKKGTQLKIHDATFGRIDPGCAAGKESGWQALFEGGLKAYAESQ